MGCEIQTNTPLALMKIVWIVCNACMNWSALCRDDETVKEKADTTHTRRRRHYHRPTDHQPPKQKGKAKTVRTRRRIATYIRCHGCTDPGEGVEGQIF